MPRNGHVLPYPPRIRRQQRAQELRGVLDSFGELFCRYDIALAVRLGSDARRAGFVCEDGELAKYPTRTECRHVFDTAVSPVFAKYAHRSRTQKIEGVSGLSLMKKYILRPKGLTLAHCSFRHVDRKNRFFRVFIRIESVEISETGYQMSQENANYRRTLIQETLDALAIDGDRLYISAGSRRGGSYAVVDESHFSHDPARSDVSESFGGIAGFQDDLYDPLRDEPCRIAGRAGIQQTGTACKSRTVFRCAGDVFSMDFGREDARSLGHGGGETRNNRSGLSDHG